MSVIKIKLKQIERFDGTPAITDEDLPPFYEEYFKLSIEERYEDNKRYFFTKHPDRTLSDFHLQEIRFCKKELIRCEKDSTRNQWYFDMFEVELGKLLSYYEEKESTLKQFIHTSGQLKIIDVTDPLDSIDPALIDRFKKIENNVCGESLEWNSNVRLAAFCELLYEKSYFTVKPKQEKRPVKFINNFAKRRYGADIDLALKTAKKEARRNHKIRIIGNKPPLKNLFK